MRPVDLGDLLEDDRYREKTARLYALLGPGREALVRYFCDPLMSVDLRDKHWAEKFDRDHPGRTAQPLTDGT